MRVEGVGHSVYMRKGGEVASEGGTEEPHGGKPLYMSAMFKNSRLAQKCLNK